MESVIVKPGKYFLADPCYGVPNDLWSTLLDSCEFFTEPVGKVTRDGVEYEVLGFSTAYGDGCYRGSDGFSYGVDAGLIGLVPEALCTDSDFTDSLGTWVTFTEPTECTNSGGNMTFGDITINTDDTDEDGYDDFFEVDED